MMKMLPAATRRLGCRQCSSTATSAAPPSRSSNYPTSRDGRGQGAAYGEDRRRRSGGGGGDGADQGGRWRDGPREGGPREGSGGRSRDSAWRPAPDRTRDAPREDATDGGGRSRTGADAGTSGRTDAPYQQRDRGAPGFRGRGAGGRSYRGGRELSWGGRGERGRGERPDAGREAVRPAVAYDTRGARAAVPYDDDVEDDALDREDEEFNTYDDAPDGAGAGPAGSGGREGGERRWSWRDGGYGREGGSGSNIRDTLTGEALYGVFPVLAALRCSRRTIHRAFIFEAVDLSKRKDASLLREFEALVAERGIELQRVGRHDLNLLSNDRPHQGLVLDVSPLDWASLDEFPPADQAMSELPAGSPPPVWLALDEVTDPQNLGAVVRSAYCLGAAGVLGCSRNCAPLSSTVSKASAGALEAVQLHSCRNMPRTLIDAAAKGWLVLGAAAGRGAVPCRSVRVDRPTILVLGSEGSGLRTNVRRACTSLVAVDMSPNIGDAAAGGIIDSLNVSVATGILLHSLIASAAAAGAGAAAPPEAGSHSASGEGVAAAAAESAGAAAP